MRERTVLHPPGRQFCCDTPKNPLGEQSHRHKPRVPSVETQRAQVHPTPSASTKVLPGAEPAVRAHASGLTASGRREKARSRTGGRQGMGSLASCLMSGTPLLELLAHLRLTIWSVQPTANNETQELPLQGQAGRVEDPCCLMHAQLSLS